MPLYAQSITRPISILILIMIPIAIPLPIPIQLYWIYTLMIPFAMYLVNVTSVWLSGAFSSINKYINSERETESETETEIKIEIKLN